jgi:NTE family protein
VNLGFRFDYPTKVPVFFQGNFNFNGYQYNTYKSRFFFEDLEPSYITEDELNFRFEAGIPFRFNGIIKSGVGLGRNKEIYYKNEDFSSTDTSDVSTENKASLFLASERNTLNNKQFATEGTRRRYSIRVGYGEEIFHPGSRSTEQTNMKKNYYWISARFENHGYIPVKGIFSLGYYFRVEASFKPLLSNYSSTIIEAPVFQPNIVTKGLFMEHYRAHQYIAAGVMPLFTITKQLSAKMEAYAYFPVQDILRDANSEAYFGTYFNSMRTMIHGSVSLVSVAGPLSLHLGYIAGEENPWIAQLSFGYLLFNKKSNDE